MNVVLGELQDGISLLLGRLKLPGDVWEQAGASRVAGQRLEVTFGRCTGEGKCFNPYSIACNLFRFYVIMLRIPGVFVSRCLYFSINALDWLDIDAQRGVVGSPPYLCRD